MSKCDPFLFNGITPEVYNTISKELATKGFVLAGPQGVVNGPFGIVIEYEWNEQAGTMKLEVVEKSFFVTCNQIREQLNSALAKYVS
jgi:hypothetical protein